MPNISDLDVLGARERQIMAALFRLGRGSVADVRKELPSPPTYSAVRGMLGLLEQKGFVTHARDGLRYVYSPTFSPLRAKRRALKGVIATFFRGSPERAVSALLGLNEDTPLDLDRLRAIIERSSKG